MIVIVHVVHVHVHVHSIRITCTVQQYLYKYCIVILYSVTTAPVRLTKPPKHFTAPKIESYCSSSITCTV